MMCGLRLTLAGKVAADGIIAYAAIFLQLVHPLDAAGELEAAEAVTVPADAAAAACFFVYHI